MKELESFRKETRAWLEANCPESMRHPYGSEADACWGGRNWTFQSKDQRTWLERMSAKGWTVPAWPPEYGGGGLNSRQVKVLKQELARIHARPPLESFGVSMLGPALLKFGSEELKKQHLPPIARGEIRWAQGYSEPNAGSDLASLQARAEDHGDHYLLNGSKVWTSYGDLGDWMFCLVRTGFEAKKHEGISFVLFDMSTPGLSTRPIKLISGKSPFTETLFENVRVEKNQVVGQVNQGWTIAKYLLTHEREMIGDSSQLRAGSIPISQAAIRALGTDNGILADSLLRPDIAQLEMDARCFQLTVERARDEVKAGVSLGAASSMFKYYGTELNKRRYELLMSINGSDSLIWEGDAGRDGYLPKSWLRTKGNSIEGGTSEIQLNIIAKHILGLPG
ncbi:MAG: acyl-CoA dehydrogenase [Xanthomonadales bacterium]|nr:acyl-CoA dehydrogenase family protein [Gammaproteobacteria bacterium]MBT8053169.1 acyl-CoA dehydrogenase family protein [Gammaproteobacteria bacterium]NND56077.1 acyl-CoA dehydrogenase [Xanthomonadales bacterium]NNK50208.1 acyl-CoA dehydrogenase [Xanthomonadales bacterium]